jgi:collagenase-like PrtC family protease
MLDLNYALPDFTAGLKMNLSLIESWRNDPAMFRDGVRFDCVYDCFPRCKANGGRHYLGLQYPPERMHATFAALNDAGVKARLTFTNMFIDAQTLKDDAYIRKILDVASHYDVEIIVYSDDVADYLRQNYPFKLVLSTTREITDIEALNDALERFDYVVLNYNLNKDYDFIAQIAHPERLEVMVNELCAPNCPVRKQHYEHESRDQLNGESTLFRGECRRPKAELADLFSGPIVLSHEEVIRLRADYGIRHFKIVGRNRKREKLVDVLLYYLVKPEHHAEVRRLIGM